MVQVHSFVWLSSSANSIYWRDCPLPFFTTRASQVAIVVKNLPGSAGDVWDVGLLSGSGRSPREGHGNPLQYSCLENPMDRGAWWATVHGATKSQTWLTQLNTHTHPFPTVCCCLCWCKLIHLTRVVYFLCSFLLHWSVSVSMPVLYYYDYCSFVNTGITMAPALLFFLKIALAIMGLSWFHTWGNETPWWGRQSVNRRARSGTCHPGTKLWLSIQGSGRSRTQTVWNKTWTPCCALTPQTSLEISLKVVWNLAAEGSAGEIDEWRRDRDARVVHGADGKTGETRQGEVGGSWAVQETISQVWTALLKAPHMTSSGHTEPAISKADFSLSNPNFNLSSQVGCRELCKVSVSLSAVSLSSFFFKNHIWLTHDSHCALSSTFNIIQFIHTHSPQSEVTRVTPEGRVPV